MSRTDDLERQERERRDARTAKLQHWAAELKALGERLWAEDSKNGWDVRHGYFENDPHAPLSVLVTIDGVEFARFVRDETGITGKFGDGEPVHFTDVDAVGAAYKATVIRRIARDNLRRGRH